MQACLTNWRTTAAGAATILGALADDAGGFFTGPTCALSRCRPGERSA
jgi:hypothetical protein